MINFIQPIFLILIFITSTLLLYYFSYQLPIIGFALIKRYYNSGAYDRDIEKICKEAIAYFSKIPVKEDSLIIFDVDDTAIYNLEVRGEGTGIILPKTIAILPVLNLYKYLIIRGFKIVFITSRDYCDITKKQLIDAGYTKFEDLICMSVFNDNLTSMWKAEKRKQLSEKYTIVSSIADRKKDFWGNYNGHIVKLPNYIY